MPDFKPNFKTSEFAGSALGVIALFIHSFFSDRPELVSFLITVVGSAYIISRSLFKRNRHILIYDGHKTSETWFFIALVLTNLILAGCGRIGLLTAAIHYAIAQVVFNLSRGFTKGLTPQSHRTTISL